MDFCQMVREDLAAPDSPEHEYPAKHNSILSKPGRNIDEGGGSADSFAGGISLYL
jgi:hypothetical protein